MEKICAISKRQLMSFRPFVNNCKEREPDLRQILMQYYTNGGFDQVKALELADEYLDELKKHLNGGDIPGLR